MAITVVRVQVPPRVLLNFQLLDNQELDFLFNPFYPLFVPHIRDEFKKASIQQRKEAFTVMYCYRLKVEGQSYFYANEILRISSAYFFNPDSMRSVTLRLGLLSPDTYCLIKLSLIPEMRAKLLWLINPL